MSAVDAFLCAVLWFLSSPVPAVLIVGYSTPSLYIITTRQDRIVIAVLQRVYSISAPTATSSPFLSHSQRQLHPEKFERNTY
ncbi:hypothetical protein BKA82DRAFT_2459498 [Pisolithus tinctorius]|nr:hypothetical protein BKA82DRAFT_2459498 [Pisolithus tinctorius]